MSRAVCKPLDRSEKVRRTVRELTELWRSSLVGSSAAMECDRGVMIGQVILYCRKTRNSALPFVSTSSTIEGKQRVFDFLPLQVSPNLSVC
jgi:hypothetical protein